MYDFIIVSLPRSGSHMLASALDSHPDIQCEGEYGMIEKFPLGRTEARLRGCIVQGYHILGQIALPTGWATAKIIKLTRSIDQIADSLHATNDDGQSYSQHLEPVRQQMPGGKPTQKTWSRINDEHEAILNWLLLRQYLTVTYDALSGGKDCRAIRWEQAHRICDYLGVERHPLIPKTHKPSPL